MTIKPITKLVEAHQMGWLHRPELDKGDMQIWEKPDGKLYAHDKKQGALRVQVVKIAIGKDER